MKTVVAVTLPALFLSACQMNGQPEPERLRANSKHSESTYSHLAETILGASESEAQNALQKLFIASAIAGPSKKALAYLITSSFPEDQDQSIKMDLAVLKVHLLLNRLESLISSNPQFEMPVTSFLERMLQDKPESLTLRHAVSNWIQDQLISCQ